MSDNGGHPARQMTQLEIGYAVTKYAEEIADKLGRNRHKSDWQNLDMEFLLGKLEEEVQELRAAVEKEPTYRVAEEAVDVGGVAAMIYDVVLEVRRELKCLST